MYFDQSYSGLINYMISVLESHSSVSIEEFNELVQQKYNVKEDILNDLVEYFINNRCVEVIEYRKTFKNTRIKLNQVPNIHFNTPTSIDEYPKIVMSVPPFNTFGLKNDFFKMGIPLYRIEDEFRVMFERATSSILICSPFLEYDGYYKFHSLLLSKAKTGVEIKIIARQIQYTDPKNRYDQIKRIYCSFIENNVPILIKNYHYSQPGVLSSTHAKLIVCDYEYAYVGSGEIRGNSFEKNFEVGVILKGDKAKQLGEVFDCLFKVSSDFRLEES